MAGSGSYGITALYLPGATLPDLAVANEFADTVAVLANTTTNP
jgi:hypothetical protein